MNNGEVQAILDRVRERLVSEVESLSGDLGQLARDVAHLRRDWLEFQRIFDARLSLIAVRVGILSALGETLCNTATLAGVIELLGGSGWKDAPPASGEEAMSQNVTNGEAGEVDGASTGADRVAGDAGRGA